MLKVTGIAGHRTVRDQSGKFTVFTVEVCQVSPDGTSNNWWVERRYNDFRLLDEQLKHEGFRIPHLPSKKVFGGFDESFLQKRQIELQTWLTQIFAESRNTGGQDIQSSRSMYMFLTEARREPGSMSSQAQMFPTQTKSEEDAVEDMEGVEEATAADTETLITADPGKKISLDDFELIKVIGKGSYGKVTLVRKKDSSNLFAMKVLSKDNVKKRKQVEHTKTERAVLGKTTKHPYIVHLHYAFQTRFKLYFVLDYCPGGELFFHLSRLERFPESTACFYAAEITSALEYLHSVGVVYRDLKPENLLFDSEGHILLADFGLSKEDVYDGAEGTNSMCGTPEYLPPEMLDRLGHGTSVDWWALGMVVYEMITGLPPWYTRNRQQLFHSIRHAPVDFPPYMSPDGRSLIAGLLQKQPLDRLGTRSAEEIKSHPFFRLIDWNALLERQIPAPFNPCQGSDAAHDAKNFEQEFTSMAVHSFGDSRLGTSNSSYRPSGTFQGFTYQTPSSMNHFQN